MADALLAALPALSDAPDHGSVREDLFQLCRRLRDAMYSRPGFALRAVLHECDASSAERFHGLIATAVVEPSNRLFGEVVRRGIRRGDVRPDAVADLVFEVIPALMTYRSKVCASAWPDGDIAEMIDRVMVPLLRSHPG